MQKTDIFDFTNTAMEHLYDVVDDSRFYESGATSLIYSKLSNKMKYIPFCDYLKRYISMKAGIDCESSVDEYKSIICDSFRETGTPPAMTPTKVKLSASVKNWLSQASVGRSVVLILGFGLRMSVDDVNDFLVKAIRESELNAKNPSEVIAWYCYRFGYSFDRYRLLMNRYDTLPVSQECLLVSERTNNARRTMYAVRDDDDLMEYLTKLKTPDGRTGFSVTSRETFDRLYKETRQTIADLYNQAEDDRIADEILKLREQMAMNARLYDYDKQNRVEKIKNSRRQYTADDITAGDIEHVLCAAIPVDQYGNLKPGKSSDLNGHFSGKRFTRQRIHEILSNHSEINRFDLITMNFFIHSQKEGIMPKRRYIEFNDSTNEILTACSMGQICVANPYECFLLMCILSEDPLGTYADVMEMAYGKS